MSLPGLSLQDCTLLVRYTLDSDESVVEGLLIAFESLDVDPKECDRVLHDVVDSDALARLHESSDRHLRISLRIWGYPVVITPEDVSIYDCPGE